MTKKELIQNTAIRLFKEKGYANVSLREIAKEANTTVGNLTYHFAQKEDLILSLIDNLHSAFLIHYPENIHRAELLSYLLNSFLRAEKNHMENPFYYQNISLLSIDSPKIVQINQTFQKNLFDYYCKILTQLREDGVIAANDTQIISFSYTFITMSASWMQSITPYNNPILPKLRLSSNITNLLQPFITKDYQEEFAKLRLEKEL